MASEKLLVETREDIAYIILNDPPMNILTGEMMDEISGALEGIAANASVKGVAIKANGKAFSAGADVGEHRPEQVRGMIGSFGKLFRHFDALELPVVMAVDGAALGAGFELAMMADILLATERATFGQPEIRLGFFAPVGVVRLPELVGTARAMEITCSGRSYSAAEMHTLDLVTKVVPTDALEEALEATLKDFRRSSPLVMRLNVRALKGTRGHSFKEALDEVETLFLEELMTKEDPCEGIASFYEKRRPEWKNR